jgi:APA family basic amino acid/polyamine antiporter
MPALERRLGVASSAAIGVAAMLGAGIFFVWGPAAAAAGSGLLIALPLAALVATLNALTTTRLAMAHPVAGGVYAYARAEVGPRLGVAAGTLFLLGKTASVAAIASVGASYLWPEAARPLAVLLVVALAAVNASGVRSTALVSAIVTGMVIAVIVVALVVAASRPVIEQVAVATTPLGVLQAAALVFFAFAGYARIATLGEEVRDPRRTLPRAVLLALAIVLVLGAAIAVMLLTRLGIADLADSASPVADLTAPPLDLVVRIAAGLACLGSLLGVLAGLSRTTLALARDGELPAVLARIHSRTGAPVVAEAAIAVLGVVAVLVLDPASLVGVSACAVLGYYGIAHVVALRRPPERGLPRAVPVVGLLLCALLSLATPWQAVVGVLAVVAIVQAVRALVARVRRG